MRRYLTRKVITYMLAFFVGATIDWGIPHLMPGNPVQLYLSKFQLQPGGYAALYKTMSEAFGTSLPLWDQYCISGTAWCMATWGSASTTSRAG